MSPWSSQSTRCRTLRAVAARVSNQYGPESLNQLGHNPLSSSRSIPRFFVCVFKNANSRSTSCLNFSSGSPVYLVNRRFGGDGPAIFDNSRWPLGAHEDHFDGRKKQRVPDFGPPNFFPVFERGRHVLGRLVFWRWSWPAFKAAKKRDENYDSQQNQEHQTQHLSHRLILPLPVSMIG